MGRQTNANATTEESFQLNADQDGPVLKDESGGVIGFRTAAGALGIARGATPVGNDDLATKFYVDSVGSGISEAQHKTLRNLIHFLEGDGPGEGFANGPFTRTMTGGFFPTLREWTDNLGTKIASKAWTRSGGGATNVAPTPITWRVYNADGTTGFQAVDVVTYSGVNETSRVRTISAF